MLFYFVAPIFYVVSYGNVKSVSLDDLSHGQSIASQYAGCKFTLKLAKNDGCVLKTQNFSIIHILAGHHFTVNLNSQAEAFGCAFSFRSVTVVIATSSF